ncbi:MAG: DeoR family transcriptional regulator [Candidatus Promineifilaceae bacterium]|jgi:DNA-binding transcriptional ArsR family regulator
MSIIPSERRDQILQWLKEDQVLRIDDLAERLKVSQMTIHRDLHTLAEMGLLEKVHGGARLPDPQIITAEACTVCQMPVKSRMQFVITTEDKTTLLACCPHCGLLLLNNRQDIATALLRDFIYERITNVRQAYYVLDSRISVCCQPSVLAFASKADAAAFQQGFGGQVMNFSEAQDSLSQAHHFHHH